MDETLDLYEEKLLGINPKLLDEYAKYARAYSIASIKLSHLKNRSIDTWIPAFYLASHALELAVKSTLKINGVKVLKTHNIEELYSINKDLIRGCLMVPELQDIDYLIKLVTNTNKNHSLRYPKEIKKKYKPKDYENIIHLAYTLIRK